jgi:acyl transferase domain-containing protein/NADPH:quinone reductase-like Zn-dependent oxidoreductase
MSIAYHRGVAASQLLTAQVHGGMMAIGMSPEEVQPHLAKIESGKAVIACVNSPSSVTISGDNDAIDELTKSLRNDPAFSRRLAVDVAYHSHHMELVSDEYLKSIEHITPKKPNENHDLISFFSSVTGTKLQAEALGSAYWVSNLLGQVKFAESVKKLCFETDIRHTGIGRLAGRRAKRMGTAQKPGVDFFLELGPHSALSAPLKQIIQADVKLKAADIEYASVLVRNKDAISCALDAMAKLASLNYSMNFESINRQEVANKRSPRLLVDLPPYSWNHTRSYWAEPRMSKTYRHRKSPRTDLLGVADSVACSFEPRWRNYLRVSEIPWLMDHKIQSDIVFPAAGYICIAIEAAMQLVTDTGEISALTLREISVRSALIIPETTGIETMTSLHTLSNEHANRSLPGYSFHVYSVSKENRWTEHCTGIVQMEKEYDDPDGTKISALGGSGMLPECDSANISVIDVDHLYEKLRHVGLDYGPCFANLTSAHTTVNGTCFAEITIPNTAAVMPMHFEHPLLIHPCTLDSMFHAIFATLSDSASLDKGPLIPVSIENIRIATCISSHAGEVLRTRTHVRAGAGDTILASITTVEVNDGFSSSKTKLAVGGLRCKRLEIASGDSRLTTHVPLIYGIEWKPDPELLLGNINPSQILGQHVNSAEQSSTRGNREGYVTNLIKDFLIKADQHGRNKHNSVVSKYRSSLAELLQEHNVYQEMTQTTKSDGNKQSESPQSTTRLLRAIGSHISSISDGNETHIQESRIELWNSHWEALTTDRTYLCAAKYLELIGSKKPDISVLEICEGTGQPCTMFLERLAAIENSNQTPLCIKYTFAYKSVAELEQLKSKLARWSDLVDFMKLDIESDMLDQGLKHNSYDVITAPHGFHAVISMDHILSNLRSIMKPSGYLLILNHFRPERSILDAIMINALYLWPAEIYHSHLRDGDAVGRNRLNKAVQDANLTLCDLAGDGSLASPSVTFMALRMQRDTESAKKNFTIISEKDQDETIVLALKRHLEDLECLVALTDIANVQAKDQVCVVLSDIQVPIFADLNSGTLDKLKDVFMHSSGVLWVTHGGTIDPICPEAGLALGFARTARSESAVEPVITVDLDSLNPLPGVQTAELLFRVVKTHFLENGNSTEDREYAERGGVIMIPRVIERNDTSSDITRFGRQDRYPEQPFRQKDCPLRLSKPDMDNPQPYFTADCQPAGVPAGHIGIEVLAFGLNECDASQKSESIECNSTLGLECSGRVYAIGEGVEDLSIGDRVACLGNRIARTFYHSEASAFQKIDDNMSYELAAALPVAYTTAYYVVHYLARIRPHDTILIEDAASWYGQAIIEVCYMRSAVIVATVKNATQKEVLINRFQIPPHRVLSDGEVDIPEKLMGITNGRKADVAITFSADPPKGLDTAWKCVAPFGRLIQLRTRDNEDLIERNVSCPMRNVVFSTFNIFDFQRERTDITRHIFGKVIRFFHEGRLRGPSSFRVQRVGEIEQALNAIPSEEHVVIMVGGDDVVKVRFPLSICLHSLLL